MNYITKIDNDKYIILKSVDVKKYLTPNIQSQLMRIVEEIQRCRLKENKPDNQYCVLNMNDEIDTDYLSGQLVFPSKFNPIIKVQNIAVSIVNAILRTEDE